MTKRWTATKLNIQPKRLASKRSRAFHSKAIEAASAQVYREQAELREALFNYDPGAPDFDRRKMLTTPGAKHGQS